MYAVLSLGERGRSVLVPRRGMINDLYVCVGEEDNICRGIVLPLLIISGTASFICVIERNTSSRTRFV